MAASGVPEQKSIIAEAANRFGVRPDILWGLYGTETGFGHDLSTSSAGAVGPFQFLPSTARGMGVNPNDFRSAAFGAARYLSQYKDRGIGGMLSAYNAGPAGAYQPDYVKKTLANAKSFGPTPAQPKPQGQPAAKMPSIPGVQLDQAAYRKAQTASMIGNLISSTEGTKDNPLFASGLLSTKAPNPQEFMTASPAAPKAPATTEAHVVPGARGSTYFPAGTDLTKLKGAVDFGGKKVASWIAPILQYAKQHGWSGTVESGYRSLAEQTRIYDSGVRPAAKPGTSNHEFTTFPGGAVDVTNASQLSDVLSKSPYAKVLVWAGSKDPVHFSHPHNGSY